MRSLFTKFIALMIAVMLIAALAACGGAKDASKTDSTAATEAATEKATEAATEPETLTEPATSTGKADSSSQETKAKDGSDEYIDEATAIANVRQLAGSGAKILSSYKGYNPDGFPAWIITVAPVTTADGPETVTYYSGFQFCYTDYVPDNGASGSDEYAGISEEEAKNNALSFAGMPYSFVSITRGSTPDGFEAWVVQLRYDVGSAQNMKYYYVSSHFCYEAE